MNDSVINSNLSPSLSRRSMLRLSAAGLSGLALAMALPEGAVAETAGDEYGGLPMGIQSYTLRDRPYKNAMETMKNDYGLHYVEVYSNHVGWTASPDIITIGGKQAKPEDALSIARDNGVTIVSIGAVGISTKESEVRPMFEFAKKMGMKNMSISPDPKAFDLLDKLTEEYNITCGIHDHGPEDKRWGKIAQIQEGLKDHSLKIGLCNDTGHFIRNGEDPLKAFDIFKDRLHAMHLKDFKKNDKGKWEDCVLGDGSLDVEGIVKYLLDVKFTGALSIEYEGGEPVAAVKKSLDRLKAAVAKVMKK